MELQECNIEYIIPFFRLQKRKLQAPRGTILEPKTSGKTGQQQQE